MQDFFKTLSNINIFDIIFLILMMYFIIQCFFKGFSLSFISFMKWVFALIVTIVLVPKLQPWVNDYIESEFINNFGIGIGVFICTIFLTIIAGKSLSRAVTWTGVGSKPSFTQTTPGQAFQFTETYSGPGLQNHTIIQRTTEVTSVTDTTSIFSQ